MLEELLLEALAKQPCHVSFSGGLDSSAILAAATAVARRAGLPEPVPLTARYPHHPATDESEWQEAVIRHLQLKEWVVFEVDDQLDILGDMATTALRRHGPYLPPAAHSMMMICRQAGSGTLLTGTGGDEIFSPWSFRRRRLRDLRRLRPRARGMAWAAVSLLPGRLRVPIEVRRMRLNPPDWLQPGAQAELLGALRSDLRQGSSWREELLRFPSTRVYEVVRAVLSAMAADEGVRLTEPFYDGRFLAALAARSPRNGFRSREEGLAAVVGDLLPRKVLSRSTKATFNTVFAGPRARAFASTWDGRGLSHERIDAQRLRAVWLEASPDFRSLSALGAAWLARQ